MYGFLKIPSSALPSEKRIYRKYMCALCDSLHESYGIIGRLFVNYDLTTLALLIGALHESLSTKISEAPKYLCLRAVKYKKAPDVFKFPAAISIMTVYTKFLDKAIENNKAIPKWIIKISDSSGKYLSRYGLSKSFFENKLQEQHRLERGCSDIEALSNSTAEGMSKVFCVIGELINKPEYSVILQKLGFELGKLIYIYDGIVDYENDLKNGVFNCINACYSDRYPKNMPQVPEEIHNIIKNTKKNIYLTLNEVDFKSNAGLIKKILLHPLKIEVNEDIKELNKSAKTKTSLITYHRNRLTKQVIYGILISLLAVRGAEAASKSPPGWLACLIIPAACCIIPAALKEVDCSCG